MLEDGRPRVALIYGVYAGQEAAQTALHHFPEEAAKYKPMLKKLDSVITQMEHFTLPDS
jgi:septal ring-binding cell division protein DamX